MKRRTQTLDAPRQQSARPLDTADRARQRTGWLTVHELAEQLRFTVTAPSNPDDACRSWLRKHGIVGIVRGKHLLISQADVDATLRRLSALPRQPQSR